MQGNVVYVTFIKSYMSSSCQMRKWRRGIPVYLQHVPLPTSVDVHLALTLKSSP